MKHGPYTTAATVLIALVVCLINVCVLVVEHRLLIDITSSYKHDTSKDAPLLDQLPGKFETVTMVIEENHLFSLENDTAWANTIPADHGFVRLGPQGRTFGIAAYHQLHCINAIRFSYSVARDGLVRDPDVLREKIGHDNHCFQFIRQSILCKADDALVAVGMPPNRSLPASGFGATHRCRNWRQVRDFVVQNTARWEGVPYIDIDAVE